MNANATYKICIPSKTRNGQSSHSLFENLNDFSSSPLFSPTQVRCESGTRDNPDNGGFYKDDRYVTH